MKQTVVPAQVTTVEDRIVGSLGLMQIVLVSIPILATGLVFVLVPPTMHLSAYKLVGLTLLAMLCGGLAIRIKGVLVLFWIIIRLRYNVRPRYYVFNKNTIAQREQCDAVKSAELTDEEPIKAVLRRQASKLTTAETIQVFDAIDNPAAHLTFSTNKKGNLYVRITEVKSKG